MAMKLSGLWNPRALVRIRPIDALFDSAIPFVSRYSMEASIEVRVGTDRPPQKRYRPGI